MKQGRIADFLFVGVSVVPAVLTFAGFPDLAILNLVPLLFAACLFGMAEQVEDDAPKDGPGGDAGSPPRDAPTLTYRKSKVGSPFDVAQDGRKAKV